MADAAGVISEYEKSCRIFADRMNNLRQEALSLREYAMQVQEVYQSEINIRQNDIMRILTIVTTIFFPLTLITGWYGMNFRYMPEFSWKFGYPAVAGIGVLIVVVGLLIFKKKKFF
jgi:magnesium transporter